VLVVVVGEMKFACLISEFYSEYNFIVAVEIASGSENTNRD
jgi:hypothetical protein